MAYEKKGGSDLPDRVVGRMRNSKHLVGKIPEVTQVMSVGKLGELGLGLWPFRAA